MAQDTDPEDVKGGRYEVKETVKGVNEVAGGGGGGGEEGRGNMNEGKGEGLRRDVNEIGRERRKKT